MVQDEGGTRQPRRVTQHWEHDGKTRTCQELQGELVPTESRARGLLYCLYSLIAEKRNSRKLAASDIGLSRKLKPPINKILGNWEGFLACTEVLSSLVEERTSKRSHLNRETSSETGRPQEVRLLPRLCLGPFSREARSRQCRLRGCGRREK